MVAYDTSAAGVSGPEFVEARAASAIFHAGLFWSNW
jgi:hypothetical protein